MQIIAEYHWYLDTVGRKQSQTSSTGRLGLVSDGLQSCGKWHMRLPRRASLIPSGLGISMPKNACVWEGEGGIVGESPIASSTAWLRIQGRDPQPLLSCVKPCQIVTYMYLSQPVRPSISTAVDIWWCTVKANPACGAPQTARSSASIPPWRCLIGALLNLNVTLHKIMYGGRCSAWRGSGPGSLLRCASEPPAPATSWNE